MRKLTILVDMDDVMDNLLNVWVPWLNCTHDLDVSCEDIKEWDMRTTFTTLMPEEIYAPLKEPFLWKILSPKKGAVDTVKSLIDQGHRVVVVTASHPDTVAMKLEYFLFKYFPFLTYRDVIITSDKTLIKGDVLIDDAPHNLIGGEYKGIIFTAPHNEDFDAEGNGFLRADTWEDIYKIIMDIANDETGELNDCN